MKEIIIEVPDRFGQELKPEKVNSEIKGGLVRCKNCTFHDSGENEVDAWNRCRLHKINTNDEEYCSWAVK